MVKAILAALVAASVAHAQETVDIGGIAALIADKAKEAKVATLIGLDSKVGGAAFLPIWTLHNSEADYAELGAGGFIRPGGHGTPLISISVNIPAISAHLWNFDWAKSHVRRAFFPPIFAGPYVLLPMPGNVWTLANSVGAMVSVRLGAAK